MNVQISNLLRKLKAGLSMTYGERLKRVYFYGSYARGEEDKESDLDILVVLEDFERYAHEVDRTGQLVGSLSLEYGISISNVFVREREWLYGDTPFLANLHDEAIPA